MHCILLFIYVKDIINLMLYDHSKLIQWSIIKHFDLHFILSPSLPLFHFECSIFCNVTIFWYTGTTFILHNYFYVSPWLYWVAINIWHSCDVLHCFARCAWTGVSVHMWYPGVEGVMLVVTVVRTSFHLHP